MKPLSLPLRVAVGDKVRVASGFLLEHAGSIHLVTVAHIGEGTHPTRRWNLWATTIFVPNVIDIDLFDFGPFGERVPLFSYIRGESDRIPDLVWIRLTQRNAELLQSCAEVHKLVLPESFGDIVAEGYPASAGAEWPRLARLTGHFIGMDRELFGTTLRAEDGFSGSPVIAAEGGFVGMLIGHGDGVLGQVMPAHFILERMEAARRRSLE